MVEILKKIFIYGSCVSRDVFELADKRPNAEIVYYQARSSMCSAFDATPIIDGRDKIQNLPSNFQRKMLSVDFDKTLAQIIQSQSFDCFLVDLIDERYDCFYTDDGEVFTISSELRSIMTPDVEMQGRIISSRTEEFFRLWEKGWAQLVEIARRDSWLNKILVNKVYWAMNTEQPDESKRATLNSWAEQNNRQLENMYRRMSMDLKKHQFIEYPRDIVVADMKHKWGYQPYHYEKTVYDFASNYLNCFLLIGDHKLTLNKAHTFDLSELLNILEIGNQSDYITLINPNSVVVDVKIFLEYDCDECVGTRDFLLSIFNPIQTENHKFHLNESDSSLINLYAYIITIPNQRLIFEKELTIPANVPFINIALKYFYPQGGVTLRKMSIVSVLG